MAEQKVVGLVANPNAPEDWVEIEQKGIDGTTRVHPRSVKHWEARGWSAVKETKARPAASGKES
ncbi:hypothetical protein [Pseudonocardia broussonetiae]|uniref:Uncharacterized protein n=1 Tax=Pseudonocardia broussonetiae TaxID=2736640 RepID=A0A6M6JIB9_9PSEU|nr:hypothetical protein [Pseudonocardia broussonetiae]QJY46657.1 hypothetical protein HOP40_13210 [Pseudonocardia broussonetiae]